MASPARSVLFFGTCLADAVHPEAAMAAMRLLRHLGVAVRYPLAQGCCGQPAYNSGFPEQARQAAESQLQAFSGSQDPVVVPSGSCAGMLRGHYPALFKGHPRLFEALEFSGRVREFCEFLAFDLQASLCDTGPPVTVAWHSCCHALRETRSTAAAKTLLRSLANVTLRELSREHECCGFGGTFSFKRHEISAAMARDKLEDVRAAGADLLLSADCGCLTHLSATAEKQDAPLRVMHVAHFLWERIHG